MRAVLHGVPGFALTVCSVIALAAAPISVAEGAEPPPLFDGAWAGDIVYARAEIEFAVRVDVAPGAEGGLAGTVDIPTQRMKHYPLTRVETDGTSLEMMFTRWTERADGSGHFDAEFIFRGELIEDGRAIEGDFKGWLVRGKDVVPFRLERIGEAGDPEPAPEPAEITDLSSSSEELASAFNEAGDMTRVVLLLSPT